MSKSGKRASAPLPLLLLGRWLFFGFVWPDGSVLARFIIGFPFVRIGGFWAHRGLEGRCRTGQQGAAGCVWVFIDTGTETTRSKGHGGGFVGVVVPVVVVPPWGQVVFLPRLVTESVLVTVVGRVVKAPELIALVTRIAPIVVDFLVCRVPHHAWMLEERIARRRHGYGHDGCNDNVWRCTLDHILAFRC